MLKNMQQSDQTSFMQNTAQMQSVALENVASPQSSQLDDPMNPLIDISEMIDFSDLVEWDGLVDKSDHKLATQLLDFDDWAATQLDVFEGQDISFLSQIEQQCAALDAFPQSKFGF
jgi:hypothetical protein